MMISLSQLVQLVAINPWLSIGSFIVGVFSILFTIVFYIKSKKIKKPLYDFRSFNIMRDSVSKIDSLVMLYSGQRIKNLTVTKMIFWNAGNDTIRYEDIADLDPLTLHIKGGCEILDAKILHSKNQVNGFKVAKSDDQSYIKLDFKYMDKDDGVVIQIFHTAKSHEDLDVRGTIMGCGRLICNLPILGKISSLKRKTPKGFDIFYEDF